MKRVKLKCNSPPLQWKNWDGVKVYTTSARYVEWVEFERFPDSDKIKSIKAEIDTLDNQIGTDLDGERRVNLEKCIRDLKAQKALQCFKLSPAKFTAVVQVSLDDAVSERVILKGVSVTQIPINMNDATTGHKLQGMSKDKLIVVSWSYISNWIYVVLSRVRTLKGLFMLKPLPIDCMDKFQVPRELQAFELRMRDLERVVIEARERNMAALDVNINE